MLDPTEGQLDTDRTGQSPFQSEPTRPKHIIIGIDGTWQAAFKDIFQSNVYRLNLALNYEDRTPARRPQVFIYSAGVGTANRSSQIIAGATGEGLSAIILEAYINLVANYVPGDKIYIFGFSRGAFAARALSSMISYSGLLKAESSALIEQAWAYFKDDESPKANFAALKELAVHPDVRVEFLGVWDTVSGPYKKEQLLKRHRFTNLELDRCVKHGVHIVSIDDSRSDYSPILWEGAPCSGQTLDQIWMPGVHGDVGGGYPDDFLATMSLLLMIDKLAEYCPDIAFDNKYVEGTLLSIIENQDVVINNERSGFWRYFGRSVARNIERNVLCHHREHPLVSMLLNKTVRVRKTQQPYAPSFFIPRGSRLGKASLQPHSWYMRKVEAILLRRFPSSITIRDSGL
ncbi:DUF2235 domain-containing protein [Bradyrhizobium sp. LA6.12]|uniref:DUF2235 domain-containing protein n=1 Tax=unclassified Bradyrhizobium TaxID=2631580 RepID=UPI00339514A5